MILLLAIVAGLPAGLARAWVRQRPLRLPSLRLAWLALVAFLPQFFAFRLLATRVITPDRLAVVILVGSQLLLLVFVWANRTKSGFWLLGLGLTLNLVIIALNGGFMPISPETVTRLFPDALPGAWQIGERLAHGKDIVLPVVETRLWWLTDRFTLPAWLPYEVAFSVGDMLIALGVFRVLWAIGKGPQPLFPR